MDHISYHEETPSVEEYLGLRSSVGFSARSVEAASRGLPGSLFALCARHGEQAVGMVRIVGDGGCAYLLVDVIVLPEYQGRGIGTELLRLLGIWMDANIPPGGMVTLTADEPGRRLYERMGFSYTAPQSLGMKKHYPV